MITAGTPVTTTSGNVPLFSGNKLIKLLKVQGLSGHQVGVISIGTSAMNTTTGVGVMYQLAIPSANQFDKFELSEVDAPNGQNLGDFFVTSSNVGDIVIFSYVEQ